MEYALPSYHVGNVSFVGRCDRVDSLVNRGEILVDYKLGKSSNYKGSLQLASYAAIMKNEGATIAGFYYLGHADAARLPQSHNIPLLGVTLDLVRATPAPHLAAALLQYLRAGRHS